MKRLLGALPFLLFGLAYLLEGVAELGGYDCPAFTLLDGSLNRPTITLTAEMGVYFVCALGLLFGVLKGFPRWSYAYLGMSLYFGWSYNNQNYYGVFYKWWVWLPSFAAILLGLLLTRSLKPLARLLRGTWNDWTRLSFALYAFALPMFTVIFFDGDWGVFQLYGLVFDTVLLAAGAVAFCARAPPGAGCSPCEAAVTDPGGQGAPGGRVRLDEHLRCRFLVFIHPTLFWFAAAACGDWTAKAGRGCFVITVNIQSSAAS